MLADSSKFGHIYLSHICNIDQVTAVLTDGNLAAAFQEDARAHGFPVIWQTGAKKNEELIHFGLVGTVMNEGSKYEQNKVK